MNKGISVNICIKKIGDNINIGNTVLLIKNHNLRRYNRYKSVFQVRQKLSTWHKIYKFKSLVKKMVFLKQVFHISLSEWARSRRKSLRVKI